MNHKNRLLMTLGGLYLMFLSAFRSYALQTQETAVPIPDVTDQPLCGDEVEWIMLAVAIDYRGIDYLYGLSDVIRVARVDFTTPHINVVALPRNLLVDPPATLNIQGQILLNQAYLFGSPGMDHFQDDGYGAGALAETIRKSFGIDTGHYVVVDFNAVRAFIDAIGGVEVDLPDYVDDRPNSFFPAGKQTLNGEQVLRLARIRLKYSDIQRISNQTLILEAVLRRFQEPFVVLRLAAALPDLLDSVLTDIGPDELPALLCLLPKMQPEDVVFHDPPLELLEYSAEYIMNMSQEMLIYRWDQAYRDWLQAALTSH